jgi:hypothetical protein
MSVSVDRFIRPLSATAFNWRKSVTERPFRGFRARLKKAPNKNHDPGAKHPTKWQRMNDRAFARGLEI